MISFFYEGVERKIDRPLKTKQWLKEVIVTEGYKVGHINYIFCSDDYLLEINRQHLDHDYYTDIITFDNSDTEEVIEGDMFISTERISENADSQGIKYNKELLRVMVHGILHLIGYNDKTVQDITEMRKKEDHYLLTVSF